jgi:hypothetical protein
MTPFSIEANERAAKYRMDQAEKMTSVELREFQKFSWYGLFCLCYHSLMVGNSDEYYEYLQRRTA